MNRFFLGWYWDGLDIGSERWAWFWENGRIYACHRTEDLPCVECSTHKVPFNIESSEYRRGWRDAVKAIKGEAE